MNEKQFYFNALDRAIEGEKDNKENVKVLKELKNILYNWTESVALWSVEYEGYVYWLNNHDYLNCK